MTSPKVHEHTSRAYPRTTSPAAKVSPRHCAEPLQAKGGEAAVPDSDANSRERKRAAQKGRDSVRRFEGTIPLTRRPNSRQFAAKSLDLGNQGGGEAVERPALSRTRGFSARRKGFSGSQGARTEPKEIPYTCLPWLDSRTCRRSQSANTSGTYRYTRSTRTAVANSTNRFQPAARICGKRNPNSVFRVFPSGPSSRSLPPRPRLRRTREVPSSSDSWRVKVCLERRIAVLVDFTGGVGVWS
ncbi:hypothetical protein KM043_011206 [Ampulex compressa]|nr:hypothetical protein KM043_011206 [Ampulex compressa]